MDSSLTFAEKGRVKLYGSAALAAVLLLAVAYQFVEPAPPEQISIATGEAGGAYAFFGERYRELIAAEGVDLRIDLVRTSGSLENLRLLEKGEVDLAFAQTGTGREGGEELVSLGSLYHEPLWVFHRGAEKLAQLGELWGKRMAVGPEGSGTRAVALLLLRENGLREEAAAGLPLGGKEATRALLAGEVEVAFLVAGVQVETVGELLRADGIGLLSFARAAAYGSRYRYLSSVVLHRGVIDLELDIPDRDIALLAPAATLVARRDFHPALVQLLLQTAQRAHAEGGVFDRPGDFPSPLYADFSLHEAAHRYFEHGPSFLQRYLPFWLAVLVQRLKILIVPLITLLIPLFKVMPPLYRWRVRSRIYRWYRALSSVEVRLEDGEDGVNGLMAELDRIEDEVTKMEVPLSYQDEVYNLRLHIDLVRGRTAEVGNSTESSSREQRPTDDGGANLAG